MAYDYVKKEGNPVLTKTPRSFIKPRKTYKDVLTPTQAVEMEQFLITLTKGVELCKQAGVKPNISAAMWSWGNVPLTAGERVIIVRLRKREEKANGKAKRV